MILKYTGANAYNVPQPDPMFSLGGFVSSSVVPNNKAGNLFSDISYDSILMKRTETRGFVLENTTGSGVTDVLIGIKLPTDPNFTVEIAFVTLDTLLQRMERLPDGSASPYVGTFQDAQVTDLVDGSLNVGDLANGAKLGIWLRRTMTGSFSIPAFSDLQHEIDFYKGISDATANFSKKIQLILKYTTT